MSSLTNFLLQDLPRRAAERGTGLIIFLLASYFFLSEHIFAEVIVTLAIVEFYFGFLIPTLRAIGVSGKGNQESRITLFLFILIPSTVSIYVFCDHLPSIVLAVIVVVLTPFILEAKIAIEKTDIKLAIKIDTKGPMVGSILGTLVLALCYYVDSLSDFGTPIVRPVFSLVAQGILLGSPLLLINFKEYSLDLRNAFKSLSGVDFGALSMGMRISILNVLSLFPEGALIVKFATVLYEPVASILGLVLRFLNSQAKFIGQKYAELSLWLFVLQGISVLCILLLMELFDIAALKVLFAVSYLLFVASLTTHFIYSRPRIKFLIILLHLFGIFALNLIAFKVSIFLVCAITLYSAWLMHSHLITNDFEGLI